MNFITKNLGWILLLIFFIFMLFIISSNDKQDSNSIAKLGVNSGETHTGTSDKNLDDLIRLIDTQELEETISKKDGDIDEVYAQKEKNVQTVDTKKTGFFAKLLGRGEDNRDLNIEKNIETKNNLGANDELNDDAVLSKGTINYTTTNVESSSNKNIIKSTLGGRTNRYVDKNTQYPGLNLETKIGKEFQVGVHTLKLNNKFFNQTLAYMNKGEKLIQLSEENMYGCFQVLVFKTQEKGYVCKKYLTDVNDLSVDEIVPSNNGSNILKIDIHTVVGSYYRVVQAGNFESINKGDLFLDIGDILRQDTIADTSTGCVKFKLVGTSVYSNHGKNVVLCNTNNIDPVKS